MSVLGRPPSPARHEPSARRNWYLYVLALLGVALLVAAILAIGPASSSTRTSREVVTAERGIVQSTVSASGNIAAATNVEANFSTSGNLSQVYVHVGQHVREGQLLATLDPTADQLSVDQARESLTAAQDELTEVENGTATGSTGSGGASTGSAGNTSNADTAAGRSSEFVSEDQVGGLTQTTTRRTTTTKTGGRPGRSSGSSSKSSSAKTSGSGSSKGSGTPRTRSGSAPSGSSTRTTTTTSTTPSPSSIASAQASVYSAQLNLHNAENTLAATRLYAPASGTIVSLASLNPGDQVSSGSASSSSSDSSSNSGSSSTNGTGSSGTSTAGTGSGASTAGSLGSSFASSSSNSSSSSGFAEIVDANRLTMTVAFSESDISKIHVGQAATVTLDALSGVELAAHVASISALGTTSSDVVSYDATLDLDQTNPQIKPGMSASATVITKQAAGVTLPNAAVSGTGSTSDVRVLKNGQTVSTPVVVGLRGTSRTQIVSGLSSGTQVVVITTLPALSTRSSSSSGSTSGASRFGGVGGFGGGGFGGAGFGGGGFRGGGSFGGGAP
jgi:multidrug efflux pump subunit AcrA (membrane-fusion protein)